ncbi:extracellular catalytic domain type 1 short-chain-length polyhydroxyalkanoate depolymerase [Halomonas korlensis]|uniref:Esterase, PHB depolymerase family n=1 Tax=Halomonas korlensis TaxID=463301 RepID=A0A1I7H732_9GAMM|nr:PHB depolymerase family esterase [Halomonas korlensis]SFU56513.1 esterase, PHB depolymerase family [Halomonas korlensis]
MINLMDPNTYMGESDSQNNSLAGLKEFGSKLGALYTGRSNSQNDRLADLNEFGSNPGALNAKIYIPEDLPADAPLVVVLHGSDQTAAEYDVGAGWSDIADLYRVALLFPEQQRVNNLTLGFNWFEPDDGYRGAGEPLSILNMVEQVVSDHGIDRQRVFITGLSAGGAMTSVMLATYPEIFAGGAIIAGLPYGSADTLPSALLRMKGLGSPTAQQLETRLRNASAHEGPWPILSVWHGSGDRTVDASNANAILEQWRALHDLEESPSSTHTVNGYPRRVWSDAEGRELIEEYSITGMDHGTPLKTHGKDSYGSSGDYMLEVNISSTHHIADFWGLTAT